ncbi:MAG: glycoside hydrolase family 130 protein [Verrucomicrobiota bacterium]
MTDIAQRFTQNPILQPSEVAPSHPDMKVECLLNPGVFRYDGSTWLIVRVAERPVQQEGKLSFPIMEGGQTKILTFDLDDPLLNTDDPREPSYDGEVYLSTLSHLRLFRSDDGVNFTDTNTLLTGEGDLESYGIEDCRVATMPDGDYLLTYTATSSSGYGVGLRTTRDWQTFKNHGMVLPPANKDCAIFDEKVGGRYVCLHRPSGVGLGGHFIWLGWSDDLDHWGGHQCIAKPRAGMWDSQRIGAGAAPIKTERGWLAIYHGANHDYRYCLGALLLDLDDPSKVIARSQEPIMEPIEPYEQEGFFGNVVFTNGHTLDGDTITLYYGASDTVICGATLSIEQILATL